MEIKEVKDKNIWEGFLAGCRDKTFLQSWNWGEFQEKMRGKIWRFGIYENGGLSSVSLVVKVTAKRGTFLLLPHGPVIREEGIPKEMFRMSTGQAINKEQIIKVFLEKLKKIAKEENCDFIRINPIWQRNEENNSIFRNLKFKPAPIQMHPEASWKLGIFSSEENLLVNMRKTTRYLIKQALKNPDIQIEKIADMKSVEIFSKMHDLVSGRQKFVPFSLGYLQNEFSVFQKDDQIILFFGKYRNKIAAASFMIFWSGVGFYHHAASFPEYAKLSVPYLLQWEAIKEAKKRGCALYDFWGYVDPKKQPRHPWAGPTLFKMGFGGKAHEYVKTQDFPLSGKYYLTFLFETLRKLKRGL